MDGWNTQPIFSGYVSVRCDLSVLGSDAKFIQSPDLQRSTRPGDFEWEWVIPFIGAMVQDDSAIFLTFLNTTEFTNGELMFTRSEV